MAHAIALQDSTAQHAKGHWVLAPQATTARQTECAMMECANVTLASVVPIAVKRATREVSVILDAMRTKVMECV